MEYLVVVVDHRPPPFRLFLFLGDLTCDVGYHRSVSGDLRCLFFQSDKSGQVDCDIDHCPLLSTRNLGALEQVDEHIGAELVHTPRITAGFETSRCLVEKPGDSRHPLGW